MAKHNFNAVLASSPARYTKVRRGGNKALINTLEQAHYNNDVLLGKEHIVSKHSTTKNNINMETLNIRSFVDSFVSDSRVVRVLCLRALRAYLISEDGAQIGRALFGSFVSFTSGLSVVPLTKSEIELGAKVVSEYSLTDKNGKQMCRSSWGVSPRGLSGTVVSSAFSTWFSFVRATYNQEDENGKYHKELACAASLLAYGKGGRVAASDSEKKHNKAVKALVAVGFSVDDAEKIVSEKENSKE